MSTSSASNTQTSASDKASGTEVSKSGSDVVSKLQTSKGNTTIADSVVQKIAGVSAREVSGVYALGGGAARAIGALDDLDGQRPKRRTASDPWQPDNRPF